MKIQYDRKPGFLMLAAATVLLFLTLGISRDMWNTGVTLDLILVVLVYLLVATLLHFKYINVAITADEEGLQVVRAGIPNVRIPWAHLQVEERSPKRRAVGGWLLERTDREAPHFLLWKGLSDADIARLSQEFSRRLGTRFVISPDREEHS